MMSPALASGIEIRHDVRAPKDRLPGLYGLSEPSALIFLPSQSIFHRKLEVPLYEKQRAVIGPFD
jgi:hypothetical protein